MYINVCVFQIVCTALALEKGALYELSVIISFDVSKPPYIVVD